MIDGLEQIPIGDLEPQPVGKAPGDWAPLISHPGLPCLLALKLLAAQVVGASVFDKDAARLDEREGDMRRDALVSQGANPIEVAGARSAIVLAAAYDLLYSVRTEASRSGVLYGDRSDKRSAHDAAVLGGRGEQGGDALVGATLVFACDVQHDVVPAVAPVCRKAAGKALGPLGEDEEAHVGTLSDDAPCLFAPWIGLGYKEVRRHADADQLAGPYSVRPGARPLQGVVEVLGARDLRGVQAAPLVVVVHVAVVAPLAHARAAVPGVPYVVHGLPPFARGGMCGIDGTRLHGHTACSAMADKGLLAVFVSSCSRIPDASPRPPVYS